jgi:hypothetical protein
MLFDASEDQTKSGILNRTWMLCKRRRGRRVQSGPDEKGRARRQGACRACARLDATKVIKLDWEEVSDSEWSFCGRWEKTDRYVRWGVRPTF